MKIDSIFAQPQPGSRRPARALAPGLRLFGAAQLAGAFAVLMLWSDDEALNSALLLWWLIALLGQSALLSALSLLRRCIDSAAPCAADLDNDLLCAAAMLGGVIWGVLPLQGCYDGPAASQLTVFALQGAVTLGGAVALARSSSAYGLFVAAALLPLCVLAIARPPVAMPQAGLALALFAFCALLIHNHSRP